MCFLSSIVNEAVSVVETAARYIKLEAQARALRVAAPWTQTTVAPDRGLADEDGVLHRAPLGPGPVRRRRRFRISDGRRGRLPDDVPGDRFDKCGF